MRIDKIAVTFGIPRETHGFTEPFPTVNFVCNKFENRFISIWNELPIFIRCSISLNDFKKKITEHLLSKY